MSKIDELVSSVIWTKGEVDDAHVGAMTTSTFHSLMTQSSDVLCDVLWVSQTTFRIRRNPPISQLNGHKSHLHVYERPLQLYERLYTTRNPIPCFSRVRNKDALSSTISLKVFPNVRRRPLQALGSGQGVRTGEGGVTEQSGRLVDSQKVYFERSQPMVMSCCGRNYVHSSFRSLIS